MDPTELPKPLTSSNLMCLGRGSSLTPTWAPTNASQFLSSGASSTRHPMDYRIDHTKQTVRFYMEQLLTIKPEGVQVVRDAEVQLERKDHVCLKSNAPLPWDDDFHILSFWKQQRFFFKEQLFKVTKEKFGTPPATPTLSELQADRTSVAWVERWPVLQQQVEAWLRSIPGRLCSSSFHAQLLEV